MYYHNQINNYENSMYIYLPIAEQPIHSLVIVGVGSIIGFIMGLVGVGGGFLLTPIMMFLGIPPPVAVASVANQLVAPSVSGVLSHWKKGNVDFKMGTVAASLLFEQIEQKTTIKKGYTKILEPRLIIRNSSQKIAL